LLLDQLGLNYSGKPSYVQPGENLELVLGDFFSVISQPVLTNCKLTLPEIGVSDKFPASLGDLYHGQQLIIAAKFEKPVTGKVTLTATRNGKSIEFTWPNVSFTHTAEAKYVPSIWAGRKIAFLLDQIRASGESSEMIDEVIALSTEYGIQTPYTSWLVNPEQVQPQHWRGRDPRPMPGRPHAAPDVSGGQGLRSPTQEQQRRAIGGAGLEAGSAPAPASAAPGGRGGGGAAGDADGNWLVDQPSADDMGKLSGEGATNLARRNAEMRETRSKDKSRVDENVLLFRKIGEQWYNRVGRFWVDERIDDKTHITVVKYGTDAWFALVDRLTDLRPALAADKNIAILVKPGFAVIVAEDEGLEKMDDAAVKEAGIPGV
jgi:hypothetical protein